MTDHGIEFYSKNLLGTSYGAEAGFWIWERGLNELFTLRNVADAIDVRDSVIRPMVLSLEVIELIEHANITEESDRRIRPYRRIDEQTWHYFGPLCARLMTKAGLPQPTRSWLAK